MAKNFQKIKNGLNLSPSTAPASPEEGDIYYSTVDGLQLRSSTGWVSPGAGSGSGELNFVDNPNDANQNWTLSAGTGDLTFATTNVAAELPLEGIISTAIKFTATTSGTKYAYTRFKVPDTLLTAKEKLEWYQKTISGFVANQWTVELWWNDSAAYTGTYTKFLLRNDVAGISYIPVITDKYYTQWNGITAAQYLELRISRATGTGAATFSMTNIIAGPGTANIDQSDQSPAMAGTIVPFSGPTTGFTTIGSDGTTLLIKNGWALANGASISQTTYSQLFANLGTTWNNGAIQDGTGGNYAAPSSGFFRLPDLRGVFLRGVGTSSRADGSGDVTKTLGQFNNDTTAPNGMTVGSTTTVNNTDLSHTHASGTLANAASAVTGTANAGVNLTHTHSISDPGHFHTTVFSQVQYGRTDGNVFIIDNASPNVYTKADGTQSKVTGITGTNNSGTLDHSHTLTGSAAAQVISGSTAGTSTSMNHAHTATTTSTPTSTELETAPRSTGVNYLIKLYDAQPLSVLNTQATSPFKAGFISAGAQSIAPQGWLDCGGQAVSRATFAELFAAIGTTYGAGDGSTTFNVPDLRGRVIAGKDDLGGTLASRLTNAIAGFVGSTLGASGGSQSLQAHVHAATGLTNSTSTTTASSTGTGSTGGGTTGTVSNDHTHNFSGTTSSGSSADAGNLSVASEPGGAFGPWTGHALHRGGTLAGTTPDGTYPGQSHTHTYSGTTGGINNNHSHSVPSLSVPSLSIPSLTVAAQTISGSVASTGAGGSQNVQPTLILNYFIKAFNDTIDVTGFSVAGPNTTGFVTNSTQTIAGVKTFSDGIVTPSISSGPPTVFITSGTATSGLSVGNSPTPITIALVSAAGIDGFQMTIKNINTGVVTVDPTGAMTIDGQATRLLNQYDSLTIFAYNNNWYII